jgi:hypothetical protein
MDDSRGAENAPPISTVVVTLVADVAGVDPADLPPLASAVDPDALDAVFQYPGAPDGHTVGFDYAGYHVVVHGTGRIHVFEPGIDPD